MLWCWIKITGISKNSHARACVCLFALSTKWFWKQWYPHSESNDILVAINTSSSKMLVSEYHAQPKETMKFWRNHWFLRRENNKVNLDLLSMPEKKKSAQKLIGNVSLKGLSVAKFETITASRCIMIGVD